MNCLPSCWHQSFPPDISVSLMASLARTLLHLTTLQLFVRLLRLLAPVYWRQETLVLGDDPAITWPHVSLYHDLALETRRALSVSALGLQRWSGRLPFVRVSPYSQECLLRVSSPPLPAVCLSRGELSDRDSRPHLTCSADWEGGMWGTVSNKQSSCRTTSSSLPPPLPWAGESLL